MINGLQIGDHATNSIPGTVDTVHYFIEVQQITRVPDNVFGGENWVTENDEGNPVVGLNKKAVQFLDVNDVLIGTGKLNVSHFFQVDTTGDEMIGGKQGGTLDGANKCQGTDRVRSCQSGHPV